MKIGGRKFLSVPAFPSPFLVIMFIRITSLATKDRKALLLLMESFSEEVHFSDLTAVQNAMLTTFFKDLFLPLKKKYNNSHAVVIYILHRPNTEFHWNSEKKVEELRASRDIQEGEELTDAYLDLTAEVGRGRSSLTPTWALQQR